MGAPVKPTAARLTLEQQRAADAWQRAEGCSDEYAKLAKGVPALITNSGLMQVLCFLHEKGGKSSQVHCGVLGEHLRSWLCRRFPEQLGGSSDFTTFMSKLMKTAPRDFQLITTEAFAWLRWVRQMAPARQGGEG